MLPYHMTFRLKYYESSVRARRARPWAAMRVLSSGHRLARPGALRSAGQATGAGRAPGKRLLLRGVADKKQAAGEGWMPEAKQRLHSIEMSGLAKRPRSRSIEKIGERRSCGIQSSDISSGSEIHEEP